MKRPCQNFSIRIGRYLSSHAGSEGHSTYRRFLVAASKCSESSIPSTSLFSSLMQHKLAYFSSAMSSLSNGNTYRGQDESIFEKEHLPSSRYPSPDEALQRLEHQRDKLDSSEEKRLLQVVTTSANARLMERVTRTLEWWHNADCLGLLVRGWTTIPQTPFKPNLTGPVLAAQLLQEWTRRASVSTVPLPLPHPPLEIFRTVLMALADEKNYSIAVRVLHLLVQQTSLEPDRDCFHRVLQACCNAGALEEATKVVEIMNTSSSSPKSVKPNRSTYKIILQTHVNQHTIHKTRGTGLAAYQFFQELKQPDLVSYNLALNALAQEGNYELAQELFLQLLKSAGDSAMMDPIPLRTVLKACSQANTMEAAKHAEDFLKNMQALPCVDARAYTTLVAIWCKLGQPERARAVLDELTTMYFDSNKPALDPRLQPDPLSFRTLIGAFSLKIVSLMTSNSSNPKSKLDQARDWASQAQEVLMDMYTTMDYTPNLVTCNAVLNCWSQARKPEAVEDFLQQMLHWNIPPDIVSYNTLISCHARLGNVRECTTWLSKMAQSGSAFPTPNTRTVTAMITALSKQGDQQSAEQAEAWFLQMQDWHADWGWDCAPNQVTLNALLTCWARVRDGPRAEHILRQFQQFYSKSHADLPNTLSYNAVIEAYGYDVKKIEVLLEELIAVGLQPDERTVKIVQNALEGDSSIPDKTIKWKELKQRFFYFVSGKVTTTKRKSKAKWNADTT